MSKYEVIFIVDARLSDAEKADIARQVTDLVAKVGGNVITSGVWLDRQKMAFYIKKVIEATYYLMNIEMKNEEMARFRRELQINERVLRFLIVKMEAEKPAKV